MCLRKAADLRRMEDTIMSDLAHILCIIGLFFFVLIVLKLLGTK